MQIAIDGPAGAGKSTVARQLAEQLGIAYLDTGAMYRALAFAVMQRGLDPGNREQVLQVLPEIKIDVSYDGAVQHTLLDGQDVSDNIRAADVGLGASAVAAWEEVRSALVQQQRAIASRRDIVMDGRDIGSNVLPDADVKIFLTASPRARAERRCREMEAAGHTCDLEALQKQIAVRDEQDMNRAVAPLMHTPGEHLVDTSDMTQDQVVRKLCELVRGIG